MKCSTKILALCKRYTWSCARGKSCRWYLEWSWEEGSIIKYDRFCVYEVCFGCDGYFYRWDKLRSTLHPHYDY